MAQLAEAPAMEAPCDTRVYGLKVIELGSWGASRGRLVQRLYS